MPIVDGKYHLSFDVPEIYMEQVDFSFTYPRCEKETTDFLGMGVIKFDIPKCGKDRKVIKFDVPRVRTKRVTIETPYGSKEEFDEALRKGIEKLTEVKKEFEKEKDETEKEFNGKIVEAKNSNDTESNVKRLGLMRDLELSYIDEAIEQVDIQIKKLESGAIG